MATLNELIENATQSINDSTSDLVGLTIEVTKHEVMLIGLFELREGEPPGDVSIKEREITTSAPTAQDAVDEFTRKIAHPREYDDAEELDSDSEPV